METVWILRNDRAVRHNLEKCAWHFTTCALRHPLKVFLSFLSVLFTLTYPHISFFPICLCLFLTNPPFLFPVSTTISPSLPLSTDCMLTEQMAIFHLVQAAQFMKTLAVDRACGKAWASDQSVREGWQFSPHPLRKAMEEKIMREVRKVVTQPSAVSFT